METGAQHKRDDGDRCPDESQRTNQTSGTMETRAVLAGLANETGGPAGLAGLAGWLAGTPRRTKPGVQLAWLAGQQDSWTGDRPDSRPAPREIS
jgi:hypothetical protein